MNTMTATAPAYGLNYWIAQTLTTRSFGHTYVHAGARHSDGFAFQHGDITFSYTGWGRSLTTRKGHKYKVHARYADGRPVPSKVLRSL